MPYWITKTAHGVARPYGSAPRSAPRRFPSPITTKAKGIPFHVEINISEGGLTQRSLIKCEDIRSIAKERLFKRMGRVSDETMMAVEDRLRILLNL